MNRETPAAPRPTTPAPTTPERRADTRAIRTRQRWLAVGVLLLAIWTAREFLTPVAWAAVLAVTMWPLYARAIARFPNRRGGIAVLFALATAVLVMMPIGIVAAAAVQESQTALGWVTQAQRTGIAVPAWLASVPLVGARATAFWQSHVGTPQATAELLAGVNANALFGYTRTIGGQVANATLLFAITLMALVAMLARGDGLVAQGERLAQRGLGEFGLRFMERLGAAIRGTVIGTVLVAVGEGTLIGIGYWIAGVPHPLLFAVLTIFVATLPFGAWFAFSIATAVLAIDGHLLAAALLFGWSIFVMMIGDNVVQPAIIGSSVRLPFLLALLGILGGLSTFGLVGLFLGPVIMAALVLAWEQWADMPRDTAVAGADRAGG